MQNPDEVHSNVPSITSKGVESPSKSSGGLDSYFQAITDAIHNFFYDVGVYCDGNAKKVMIMSIAFTLICGCGWARFESESRAEKLFTPQDSPAIEEQQWVETTFPSTQRYITLYSREDNLLDSGRNAIYDLFDIYEKLNDGTIGETDAKLANICIKNSINTCTVSGPLAFWNYDRSTFTADATWINTMSATSALDCCSTSSTIKPDNIFGGVNRDGNGYITSVKVFRTQWIIEENNIVENNSKSDPVAGSLELAFQDFVDNTYKPNGKEELIAASRESQREAISSTFAFDGILTFISYILITLFATWILSDPSNPVRSRAKLGPLTVLVVVMSVIASFGIVIACGVAFNPVVNSVVFVLLGVGVDDALVILEHMDKEYTAGTKPRLRIPNALSKAGASISLTSFTDFAAFLAGATTIIPALRYFCIFAAVAIFVDFAMQLTTFIAFLKWDEDRIEEGRVACGLCCAGRSSLCICPSHPGQVEGTKSGMDSSIDKQVGSNNEVEMTAVPTKDPEQGVVETSAATAASSAYNDSSYEKDTWARIIITKKLPDLILTPYGKIGVLVATCGLFAAAAVGIVRLQLDFQFTWFIPSGTDAKEAALISLDYFTGENVPAFMYTKDVDYYTKRADVISLCDDFAANEYIVSSSLSCWMKQWDSDTSGAASAGSAVGYANANAWYASLKTYLTTPGSGARFEGFVKWTDSSDPSKGIAATTIFAQFDAAKDANENIASMDSVRTVAAEYKESLDALVFSPPFVFWEGLKVVYGETVRNVIVTVFVVYAVCIIFLADIWAATLTTLSVIFVDVCLFGFLHWIGLHMNTVTCINLLLALGLTVDYSAHLAHAYMHVDGATKDERVRKAYDKIGVSIFQGGMTTFAAVLALAGARTYVFDSFFRCFVLIIMFGLYFGIIVLPVMLSVFGPDKVFHDEINTRAELVTDGGSEEA